MADRLGLAAIAITDHDTIEGSRQALASAIPDGLHFLTGVEISANPPQSLSIDDSLHILGYGIDLACGPLQTALEELQRVRDQRTPQIVERLNRLGIAVSLQMVKDQAGDGVAGRPHIARAMIQIGAVASIDEAFDRYLGHGKPAYVDKYRLDCDRAFEIIRLAGGIPVLAHPYLIKRGQPDQLDRLVDALCGMGLKGIEAYYSEHPSEAVRHYLGLAERHDLIVTGGSDFHGDLIPDIHMGSGHGDLFVPFSVYEAIIRSLRRPE
jgi:predicted metal-dependent phosphoesterase TrpH